MSTNYYLYTRACEDACKHCKEEKEWHLAKTGSGFIIFQGYDDLDGPGDESIKSWNYWIKILAKEIIKGGVIKDEYSRAWSLAEFILFIDSFKYESRTQHYNWCKDNGHLDGVWKDHESYTFSSHEFE